MTIDSTARSERLDLVLMTPAFLVACLKNDLASADQMLGVNIAPDLLENRWLLELRLEQVRNDPSYAPWLLRAIVRRDDHAMIGHIGFHTAPGPDYLAAWSRGAVEIGYTVFPAYRQQGYAREACAALIDWAHHERGVDRFVLSISPTNTPSLRIAHSLGFAKIGTQEDDDDGPEDIFELNKSALA